MRQHNDASDPMLRLLLLAALCTAAATNARAKDTELAPATLWLRIQADGKPADVRCAPNTAEALCQVLVRAVSRWSFTPARRSSVPEAAEIALGLPLVAVRQPQGGFALRATAAIVALRDPAGGEGGVSHPSRTKTPPRYPPDELRRRQTATVVLEISRQPGAIHPVIDRAWVDGKEAREKNTFVTTSKAAVAQWELVPWPPELRSTCISIEYSIAKPKREAGTQSPDTRPCVSRYADGYEPPVLGTDALTATF
jgi:hypothetical protein